MKVRSFLLPLLLLTLSVGLGWAQNCDQSLVDNVNVLNNSQFNQIQQNIVKFNDAGGILKVRIVDRSYQQPNLAAGASRLLKSCPSWQAPNGRALTNLGLLLIATDGKHGDVGFYYGDTLKSAYDGGHWESIKATYLLPALKNQEYGTGLQNTVQQLTARQLAARDEAKHPVQQTTNNIRNEAPTDYSWLKWLIFLTAFGFGIYLLVVWWNNRRRNLEDVTAAQQDAIQKRVRAANLLSTLREQIETAKAVGDTVSGSAQSYYEAGADAFTEYSQSEKNNPNTDGLSEGAYKAIAIQYADVINNLTTAQRLLKSGNIKASATIPSEPTPTPASSTPSTPSTPSYSSSSASAGASSSGSHHHHHRSSYSEPVYDPTPSPSTVYVDRTTYVAPPPVFVPSPSVVVVNNDVETHHHHHSDDYDTSFSGGSSSSSGGGFSSDSDSSSSFGGGSSSSYDSSSSYSDSSSSYDSGSSFDSGGSSDFGGGSDSSF